MGRSRGPGVALAWVQTYGAGVPPSPPTPRLVCVHPWAVSVKEGFFLKLLFKLEVQSGAGAGRAAKEPRQRCWSPVLQLLSFSFSVWLEEKKRQIAFCSLPGTVCSVLHLKCE